MNKDIVDCIAKSINQKKELQQAKNLLREKAIKDEEELKAQYIKNIKEFFKDLPMVKDIIFSIKISRYKAIYEKNFWGRDTNIIKDHYYESLILPNTRSQLPYYFMHIMFGFDDDDRIEIGFSDHSDQKRMFWNSMLNEYTSLERIQYIHKHLPWFEEQLAKQYGCLK